MMNNSHASGSKAAPVTLNLSLQDERTWKGTAMNDHAFCCLNSEQNPKFSVRAVSKQEADQFKWIESQKVGHDLGELALHLWIQKHWWGFLRARLIEHLQGLRFWTELDLEDFGLLQREFLDQQPLLNTIVTHLLNGKDNLEIIIWSLENQMPMEQVIRILERININARRLICEFNNSSGIDSDQCWFVRK